MSASIDLPILSLAKKINIDSVYASKLSYANGICTGLISNDFLHSKNQLIEKLKRKNNKIFFYSDNHEDIEIFKEKNIKSFIIYHDKKELFYWSTKLNKMVSRINFIFYKKHRLGDNLNKPFFSKRYLFLYIPSFYYFLTRPAFLSVLLKEIVPLFFLIVFIFGNHLDVLKIVIVYFVFFSLYDIGSFYNDNYASKNEINPTIRLDKKIKINFPLFVLVRIFFFVLIYFIFKNNYGINLFVFSLISLILLLIHSLVKEKNRWITFILLVLNRSLVPVISLFSGNFFIFIFFIFVHLWRCFYYLAKVFSFRDLPKLFLYYLLTSFLFVSLFGYKFGVLGLILCFYLLVLNYLIFVQQRYEI